MKLPLLVGMLGMVILASPERRILETVQLYRISFYTLNPYSATLTAQSMKTINKHLYAIFDETRYYYENVLCKQFSSILLPGYPMLRVLPQTIPYEFLKMIDNFLDVHRTGKTPFLMAIEQWNYYCSIRTRISNREVEYLKTEECESASFLANQLKLAQLQLEEATISNYSNDRENVSLYHRLEFLRHLACMGWDEARKNGYIEILRNMWNEFISHVNS